MNIEAVIWWFGAGILALAAAMTGPVLMAVLFSGGEGLSPWALSALLCLFAGAGLLVIVQNRPAIREAKGGIREIVIALILWWTIVPFFAALPFLLQGTPLIDSWFESVSAMTTTGAWLSNEGATASLPGMIWRAELQWLGGLVSMAAAAAVFIRPEFVGIDTVIPPFSRGETASYLQAFRSALTTFLPAYVIITLGAGVLLSIAGVPFAEAGVMALSLAASGGFVPAEGGIGAYGLAAQGISMIVMILSAVSFVTLVTAMRLYGSRTSIGQDRETPAFLVLIFLISGIFLLSTEFPSWSGWSSQLFNAVSVLSTNGITVGEQPALIPVLVTAIIGGAAISTAGGLKLLRWLVTFTRAREEIWKLIHPQGVSGRQSAANELGVWIHYISFTLILSLMVLTITIFGYSLELAVTASVAVISNAGPIIVLSPGIEDQYDVFAAPLRVILAIGMIVGRLEMVVALALLNRFFWRS